MNFIFAWRYFKAKKSTNAINIIAWISILAIMVGTAALILVLSVFNGFEDLVKSLYSSFYPDVKISPVSSKQISLTEIQLRKLKSIKGVRAVSLVIEEKAMLINGDYQANVYLKGVDDVYTITSGVDEHMVKGVFDVGDTSAPMIVLGAGVESAVGIQSDRALTPLLIYTGKKGEIDLQNPLNSVSSAEVATSGAFVIQQEFDDKYALTNLLFARQLLSLPEGSYSAAEIAINKEADPKDVVNAISAVLGKGYKVLDRYQQNASLYAVMQAEKWVIYAILSLILIVAAFNMIGALTMLVLEKKQDIQILHALGASKKTIRNIFLSEGFLLSLIGGGVGMLLSFLVVLAQLQFKLIPLQGGSFVIDYFPVKLNPWDFLLVGLTVMFIGLIASYLPARKAAHQQFSFKEE